MSRSTNLECTAKNDAGGYQSRDLHPQRASRHVTHDACPQPDAPERALAPSITSAMRPSARNACRALDEDVASLRGCEGAARRPRRREDRPLCTCRQVCCPFPACTKSSPFPSPPFGSLRRLFAPALSGAVFILAHASRSARFSSRTLKTEGKGTREANGRR